MFAVLSSAVLTLAADRVTLEYPGLRIYTHEGRVRAIYGRPTAGAATSTESAQLWWKRHAESFVVYVGAKLAGEPPGGFLLDAIEGDQARAIVRTMALYAANVVGHVGGNASPGLLPDVEYNLAVEMSMPEIEVRIVGGTADFADRDGDYVLVHGGTDGDGVGRPPGSPACLPQSIGTCGATTR